ncbi:hypothetical protein, partial [Lentzea flava]|uniref:hypothetical protein n=1 Tax=Lentzea flava TaxID=103732 RepID=UPI001E46BE8E
PHHRQHTATTFPANPHHNQPRHRYLSLTTRKRGIWPVRRVPGRMCGLTVTVWWLLVVVWRA